MSKVRLVMGIGIFVGGLVAAYKIHDARQAEEARRHRLARKQQKAA